ncbi:MAG: methyltransferase domain-containing protein [Vulcanimicrobiaceae bacterium]
MLAERCSGRELIDGPIDSIAELSESFRDIALANRSFGGIAVARFALRHLQAETILDVGTGGGDIPASLSTYARRRGRPQRFTCSDTNADVLGLAARSHGANQDLTFVRADGMRLPFDDAAFDVAMCNLTLHHLDPPEAVALLRELRRVSRLTPVVTDLRRSALTWLSAVAFSRLFTRNRLTRHDAPMSARRAYTKEEGLRLAREAGWIAPKAESFEFIRMVLSDAAPV